MLKRGRHTHTIVIGVYQKSNPKWRYGLDFSQDRWQTLDEQ
jgi:hypothetical protein